MYRQPSEKMSPCNLRQRPTGMRVSKTRGINTRSCGLLWHMPQGVHESEHGHIYRDGFSVSNTALNNGNLHGAQFH